MTIFGFNTDIRSGDTVYHVQTEAHETERSMQTAVFVRGRCIGKYSSSYATEADQADSSGHVHELLKQQHRFVVSSIREGRIETLLNSTAAGRVEVPPVVPASAPASGDSERAPGDDPDTFAATRPAAARTSTQSSQKSLGIELLSSRTEVGGSELLMRFRVVAGPAPVEGAKLIARLDASGSAPCYSQSVSDCEGEADVRFGLEGAAAGVPITVLVQTAHRGESAVRRFRLRRS